MAPPVFKTGLAANTVAGGFDSLPPPPRVSEISLLANRWSDHRAIWPDQGGFARTWADGRFTKARPSAGFEGR